MCHETVRPVRPGRVKRAFDVTVSAIALVLASPFIGLAVLAARLQDGGPGLFTQRRIGRHGRPFTIYKVRTMAVNDLAVDEVGQVASDHPLVTPVGRLIRRLKIDELPQLVNVLRGEMSLIGPRPTIQEQVDAYDEFQRRRLEVRPGVTGWAQVSGNVSLDWGERIALDVWYVDHRSWVLDAKILLRTVAVVLRGEVVDPDARRLALEHEDRTRRSDRRLGRGA